MTKLNKELGLFSLIMIAIGATIGSGIFVTPSAIAHHLLSPMPVMVVWIVGGLVVLCGALTYAEIGSIFPGAGGFYLYLSEAYGGFAGFMYGWAYLLVINTGALAALSVASTMYFESILGYAGIELLSYQKTIIQIATIVLLTIVNIPGVKYSGMFSDTFTVLKLTGIAVIVVFGFMLGNAGLNDYDFNLAQMTMPEEGWAGAFAAAMVGVLWSYGGYQHATFLSGEAKNAKRNIPRALVLGTLAVLLVYILINLSYFRLLPIAEIAGEGSTTSTVKVAAVSMSKVWKYGGLFVSIVVFLSVFGTIGIYILSAPRIYFAMARDGIFFKQLAELHPQYQTPVNAILLQSAWSIILLLFWGTFENLINYVVFTDWIFFVLVAVSIFVFRYMRPDAVRTVKTPLFPIPPIIFIGISGWFIINTLMEKPQQALAGLVLLCIGGVVYYFYKEKKKA